MGTAYSQDLRQRALAALDGGMSKMAAHKVFGISRSTLDDWLGLRAATGSVEPAVYKRGPQPQLQVAQEEVAAALRAFVQEQPDRTLKEMAVAWHQRGGARVSATTFSIALRRLGQTRKKRACSSSSGVPSSERTGSRRSSAGRPSNGSTSTKPEPKIP